MKNPVMQQQKEKSVPTIKACKGREVYLAVRLVYGYAGLDSKKTADEDMAGNQTMGKF